MDEPPSNHNRLRIISRQEAEQRLNAARSTLYEWTKPGHKNERKEVPKPIVQGGRSGFIELEIDEYILGLMRARGGASEQ